MMYSLSLVSETDCNVNPEKNRNPAYCPKNELAVKRNYKKMIWKDNNAQPNMDPTGTQIQVLNYFLV